MKTQPTDTYFAIASERKMYQDWMISQNEIDSISVKDLKRERMLLLTKIVENELPERQKLYFKAYIYDGLRVKEIAEIYGVHKTTVSRMLKDACGTVRNFAKYLSIDFYKISEQSPLPNRYQSKLNSKPRKYHRRSQSLHVS